MFCNAKLIVAAGNESAGKLGVQPTKKIKTLASASQKSIANSVTKSNVKLGVEPIKKIKILASASLKNHC